KAFMAAVEDDADRHSGKLTAKRQKRLRDELGQRDDVAAPIIKRIHRPGKVDRDPLHGRNEVEVDGQTRIVDYEPDPDLRDTEQVPLLEDDGIEAFIDRE